MMVTGVGTVMELAKDGHEMGVACHDSLNQANVDQATVQEIIGGLSAWLWLWAHCPAMMVFLAVSLILPGLGLGLPYVKHQSRKMRRFLLGFSSGGLLVVIARYLTIFLIMPTKLKLEDFSSKSCGTKTLIYRQILQTSSHFA